MTEAGPSGAMSPMVASSRSTSVWNVRSTCDLARDKSSCASWLPARSSMLTSDRPRWISETRMGEMSPSSSSRPFVKAAPVFITRPSSEVRILRSWRNVACSLKSPAPSADCGYIECRKCSPSVVECCTPSSVSIPPHLSTKTTWRGTRSEAVLSSSSPGAAGAHAVKTSVRSAAARAAAGRWLRCGWSTGGDAAGEASPLAAGSPSSALAAHAVGLSWSLMPLKRAAEKEFEETPTWNSKTSHSAAKSFLCGPSSVPSTTPRRASAKERRSLDSRIRASLSENGEWREWNAQSLASLVATFSLRFGVRSPCRTTAMTLRSSRCGSGRGCGGGCGGATVLWCRKTGDSSKIEVFKPKRTRVGVVWPTVWRLSSMAAPAASKRSAVARSMEPALAAGVDCDFDCVGTCSGSGGGGGGATAWPKCCGAFKYALRGPPRPPRWCKRCINSESKAAQSS
mmetsp:Transcript_9746/g.33697  ORF Transcript_9746/g.33697 Transcript_9746/m.33697 type:complete len:455 (-) Transcript_9746:1064-2428(-)